MKTFKKIMKIISIVLFILIALLALLAIIQNLLKVTILPYRIVYVLTNSMEDTIPEKSFILIKKVDIKELQVNDIITFISSDPKIQGDLNTHRIVEILGDYEKFITKGDHNVLNDNYYVFPSDVQGVYVAKLNILTSLLHFFLTKAGLITTLSLIIGIFIITQIIINVKANKEETNPSKKE